MSTYIPGTGVRATTEGPFAVAVRRREEMPGQVVDRLATVPLDVRLAGAGPAVYFRTEASDTGLTVETEDWGQVVDARGSAGPEVWLKIVTENLRFVAPSGIRRMICDVLAVTLENENTGDVLMQIETQGVVDEFEVRQPVEQVVTAGGVYFKRWASLSQQLAGLDVLGYREGPWPDQTEEPSLGWVLPPGQGMTQRPELYVYPRSRFRAEDFVELRFLLQYGNFRVEAGETDWGGAALPDSGGAFADLRLSPVGFAAVNGGALWVEWIGGDFTS
jgi:hypothetical protein